MPRIWEKQLRPIIMSLNKPNKNNKSKALIFIWYHFDDSLKHEYLAIKNR